MNKPVITRDGLVKYFKDRDLYIDEEREKEHEKAIRDGPPIVPCLAALDKQGPHAGEKMVYIDDEVEMEMKYDEPTVKRGWSTAYDIRVHGATYARLGMCGDYGPMFEFIDTFLLPRTTQCLQGRQLVILTW